jgi:hypothetical protein
MFEDLQLNADEKKQLSQLAALFFTKEEIMLVLGYSTAGMSESERLFEAARLQSEAIIRQKVLDMAKAGSTPAIEKAFLLMRDATLEELS